MPFPDASANMVLQIWRPVGEEAGGDPLWTLQVRDLMGFISAVSQLLRTGPTGGGPARDRAITAKCMIPAHDERGEVVDVQGGDELRYLDYRGIEQKREIIAANPVHVFGTLDHIILEVE